MEYVLGGAAGLAYGGLIGLLKYLFLWKRISEANDKSVTMRMVSIRLMLSYATNFVTLIAVYFVRNIVPLDFVALAVGTAVALSLSGRIFSMQKILQKTEI